MAASAVLCQAKRREGSLHTLLSKERSMDVAEGACSMANILQPFDKA